mgnify:CR=1 FL=1
MFQFKSSANSVMRGCVHARRTLKGLVADLRSIKVCGSFFHTQYNFRDYLKLLCKGICYALSLARSRL